MTARPDNPRTSVVCEKRSVNDVSGPVLRRTASRLVTLDDRDHGAVRVDSVDLDTRAADDDIDVGAGLVQAGLDELLAVHARTVAPCEGETRSPSDVGADVLVEEHVLEGKAGASHPR